MSKLLIGPGRLSFPALFQPQREEMGGKYAVTLLLPPSYDVAPIKKALTAVLEEKFGADKKKWPSKLLGPDTVVKDCSTKAHISGYEPGWKFLVLKSKTQPGIVDASLEKVTDEKAVYAGRWARVSCMPYAYDNVMKGCGLGLQNVQLLQHDSPFGGGGRPTDDFDAIAEDLGDPAWAEKAVG